MRFIKRCFFWICWPGLFLYFYGSHRCRAVIIKDGKTLLVKGWWGRLYADTRWGLPGGGLRRHEDPAEGLVRELTEELQLTADPQQLRHLGDASVSEYGLRYRASFFLLNLGKQHGYELHRSGEITATAWHDIHDPALKHQLKPEVLDALQLLEKA